MLPRMFSIATTSRGRRTLPLPSTRALGRWVLRHREALWAALLVTIAAIAHGYNMASFPYFESDEGTYMAQAWSLIKMRELAPYTYWYDHAPGGWVQIAVWTTLTGGFHAFGPPVISGRILMLLMHIASAAMVYCIARSVTRSALAPTIAVLAFALSAYGIYYHRRVLLDNIATFWMLLSIALLLSKNLSLNRVWLSAAALGISILSKELTIFLVPVLAYLVWFQVQGTQRWLAAIGWVAIVGTIFSSYLLLAVLKGELFPTGTWLGGTHEHVSLLGSLQYQTGRGRDGGFRDLNSSFWNAMRVWSVEEPLLTYAGNVAMLASLLLLPWRRLIGVLGITTLSLWLFTGRGGVTLPFYLVPLLPLLAINLGVVLGTIVDGVRALLRRIRGGMVINGVVQIGVAAGVLAFIPLGYANPNLEFRDDPLVLWRSRQAEVHTVAANWVIQNLPRESKIVIDQSMWLELHDIPGQTQQFDNAHYYWKVKEDPEVREEVFQSDWRAADYIITTNQVLGDMGSFQDPLLNDVLRHSTVVTQFDTGGWPVIVRQVHRPYLANGDEVLRRTWESYRERFIENGRVVDRGADGRTTSEGQAYALLRAVYADDKATFDSVWEWTKTHLQQESGLLAWHWGKQPDGRQGVLDAGTATDADQDAALALLFARKRWGDARYEQEALGILTGIWERTTTQVNGQRVLVAGEWAREGNPVVNPSYFAPYAYRIFAEADPRHNWIELVGSSYDILERINADPRFGGAAGVAPNWVALDATTGALQPAQQFGEYANQFSSDASRLPWRLALDCLWFNERRAFAALNELDLPARAYVADGKILSAYRTDGVPASGGESISMYAGAMGQLMFNLDRSLPEQVYREKIAAAYHETQDGAYWGHPDNYYDQNWAWFATALVNQRLGNLWEQKPDMF